MKLERWYLIRWQSDNFLAAPGLLVLASGTRPATVLHTNNYTVPTYETK